MRKVGFLLHQRKMHIVLLSILVVMFAVLAILGSVHVLQGVAQKKQVSNLEHFRQVMAPYTSRPIRVLSTNWPSGSYTAETEITDGKNMWVVDYTVGSSVSLVGVPSVDHIFDVYKSDSRMN